MIPKYVKKDIKILTNLENKTSKYGYTYTDYTQLSIKLFKIANKYTNKNLKYILEYLGYDIDKIPQNKYQQEVLHNSEIFFLEAMNNPIILYDNIKKQCLFIEIGFIDCLYKNKRQFKESEYQIKYPSTTIA